MKKFFLVLLIILLLLGGGAFATVYIIRQQAKPVSLSDDHKVRIEIPSGMSVSGAAALLAQNSLIRNEKLFYYAARYLPLW